MVIFDLVISARAREMSGSVSKGEFKPVCMRPLKLVTGFSIPAFYNILSGGRKIQGIKITKKNSYI